MSTLLYFAYGSNMLSTRILERVPSAKAIGSALLRGYDLKWHKVGKDGSGKCDVVPVDDATFIVHGVLYEIAKDEKHRLDKVEGLGFGYEERQVRVDSNGELVTAWTYYATKTNELVRPFTWYKTLVVAGAREHGLPAEYLRRLEMIESVDE